MNKLQIFKNEEFGEVRIVEINGEPWFAGKDVAEILGYTNPQKAIRDHVDEEDKTVNDLFTVNGTKGILINEAGLYELVISSNIPGAKKFRKWVMSEVLPTIRKHGMYATDELLDNPDLLIKVATALKEERELRKKLELQNQILLSDNESMKPKAEYFDDLVDRNLLTNLRNTAKELGMREKDFIQFLMDRGFIYREHGKEFRPYAESNKGLFVLKEYKSHYSDHAGLQMLITPRGRETFRLLIK